MANRTLEELTAAGSATWTEVLEHVDSSPAHVEVLEVDPAVAAATLQALQVTTGSVLGALTYRCGGMLVDHGWLRILGGGARGLPSVATVNGLTDPRRSGGPPSVLLIAFDVLGGRFAIDGGGLGIAPGVVCYLAPDTLEWESLELGHGAFVHAFLGGSSAPFYEAWRWDGWEAEVAAVGPEYGLSLHPPLCTLEGADLATVSRRPVPYSELLSFTDEMAVRLRDLGPGEAFRLTTSD